MRKLILLLALTVVAAAPAAAADAKTEVMTTVHRMMDAFNKGDSITAMAACAEQVSILDDVPPHEWHGVGAFAQWLQDYDADARQRGITDGFVTLLAPRHVDVTGDRAYVVAPANYTYKQRGKPVKEAGSTFTVALQRSAAGWRISGWAWSKH